MNDTARDVEIIDSACTEGLDELFSSDDTPGQDRSDTLDISPDDVGASFDSQDTSGQDRSDNLVSELRNQISDLKSELDLERSESQRQLQAAAFRNGYLESQLASKDEQIKLLTDSQHELGKWARFKSWFFGQ